MIGIPWCCQLSPTVIWLCAAVQQACLSGSDGRGLSSDLNRLWQWHCLYHTSVEKNFFREGLSEASGGALPYTACFKLLKRPAPFGVPLESTVSSIL